MVSQAKNPSRLGLGIIGLGVGKGALLINGDADSPIEVRAIADLDSAKLKEMSDQFSIGVTTTDYREVLAQPDIDVVGVFTPDHLHVEHLTAALDAGKHVICTKPLTTTIAGCEEIIGRVRQTGLKFLMAQTWRHLPKIVAAKGAVDRGDIGRINLIETGYIHHMHQVFERTPWRVTAPQDLLFGGGAHAFDCLRWFEGDIVEVSAFGRNSGVHEDYPINDIWILNLKFESGALGRAIVMCGGVNTAWAMNQHLQIYGTQGTIVGLDIGTDATPEHSTLDTDALQSFGPAIEGHASELVPYFYKMANCIVNDEEPEPSVLDGARAVAIGVAAQESLKVGGSVKVKNDF